MAPQSYQQDGHKVRATLLSVIGKYSGSQLQTSTVLEESIDLLNIRSNDAARHQAVLTVFHDMFLSGQLAWGYDVHNAGPPFFHITERGRETLKHLSRDPANPDGYRQNLLSRASVNPISLSYLEEALLTYNSLCYKSAAVMVGAATENTVLHLRDCLVSKLRSLGIAIDRNLEDWRISRVLNALAKQLDMRKAQMPPEICGMYEGFWTAFTQQIRAARNEAGHPVSINSITRETVQASLLIFPELADMATKLTGWISTIT